MCYHAVILYFISSSPKDGLAEYTCQCAPGFAGPNCSINIDDCAFNPCENGATCVVSCQVLPPNTPCHTHLLTLQDGIQSYTCVCAAGWTGATCRDNIDDCVSTPCQNDGTCLVSGTDCASYVSHSDSTLSVSSPFSLHPPPSPFPSSHTHMYTPHHTHTHTHTQDAVATYICTCVDGWTGTSCETNIDDCSSNPCQNGGTCTVSEVSLLNLSHT